MKIFGSFCGSIGLALALPLHAQQPSPHAGYVYPAGGRQGATVELIVGGQFLDGANDIFVSGKGLQGSVIEFTKPMSQGEFNRLRDNFRELQEKRQAASRENRKRLPAAAEKTTHTWTAADEKALADIRDKILKNPPNRDGTPAIAENVKVRLIIAADAEIGERELRLGTALGLSNPLKFWVGEMPEVSEAPAKAANPDVERFLERLGKAPIKNTAQVEKPISLPSVVNGQITPGGVDRYRFHARKGCNLVAVVQARELIPYLADAVPGWFQPTLALYDAKGKELAYDDDYRFHPDPVLHYEVLKEGDYVLEIKDGLYRGREDFVYRISIGELPFVTAIFPLGGRAGEKTCVHLNGWNLPTNTVYIEAPGCTQPDMTVMKNAGAGIFNFMLFAADTLPEFLEKEGNSSLPRGQKIELPVIINGRIDRPGERDVFRFEGRAGQELVVEVYARRLGSPLDSVLQLTDATGKRLAFNDDWEDKSCGLLTHHADSYLRATLPADGAYFIQLGDGQHKGGRDYAYRLRLSSPRPDFELRLVPSSINLRPGSSIPLTVYALRKDGFTNEISVMLKETSEFSLSGGRIPSGQDKVRMTLTAPLKEQAAMNLVFEGRAMVNGEAKVRRVIPAEDLMQAFAYRHLVPAKELVASVSGRGLPRPIKLLGDSNVKLASGGSATVRVAGPGNTDRIQFELNEPPEGISIRKISSANGGMEIVLQSDSSKIKPGLKGNLIVNVFAANTPAPSSKGKKQSNQRRAVGTLPAIPFEITSP